INSPPLDRLRFNESTEAFFLLGKDKKRKFRKLIWEKFGSNHSILVEIAGKRRVNLINLLID
ncbi:MAG: hypothetical protein NTY07_00015, partial [Bacteroidia bacterium]|nr:hypothetical protein [Bacteroidia bacterium]